MCKKLIGRGDDVWVLDVRHPPDELAAYRDVRCGAILESVTDRKIVEFWIAELVPDWVLHLGAMANTRDCREHPHEAWQVNVVGTENVLGICKELGIRSLYASTSLLGSVMTDGGDWVDAVMRMSSDVYCATKQAGESIAKRCGSVICRFGICYGPGMTPGVLFEIFVQRALKGEVLYLDGGGTIRRQYMYVEDLANGVLAAMEQDEGPYHVVPPWWTTPADVAGELAKIIPGVRVEEREGREDEIVCNVMLLNTRLGWDPIVRLDEGLRRTVDWYREQKEGDRDVAV